MGVQAYLENHRLLHTEVALVHLSGFGEIGRSTSVTAFDISQNPMSPVLEDCLPVAYLPHPIGVASVASVSSPLGPFDAQLRYHDQ
jgi:hypothetical protein